MNAKIRRRLAAYKRRIARRLNKARLPKECPVLSGGNVHCELAARANALSAGGIGVIHQMAQRLDLPALIDRHLHLLKIYLPYSESDHVLNIAYNLLAGGTCLDHLELRRNDEVYMDALGAERIPDPTTAGDFCRRFSGWHCFVLMEVFNSIRQRVWRQQPAAFFDVAVIDADGTMVETSGECKEGADFNYKSQYGYHPLVVSLANTNEPLYIVNRSGNRPSHEGAHLYLDHAVRHCRAAGFRKILLRGDTDFSQTQRLDRWHSDNVGFVFGIDATETLSELAEKLPENAWKPLRRRARKSPAGETRQRPQRHKEQTVEARQYKNIRLKQEYVAEFRYQPAACRQEYRIVAVWKDLECLQGQAKLFDDQKCFFYITNDFESSCQKIVALANGRCDQENLIQQIKSGVRCLTAPLDNLHSNWAYMVAASLAWSLKAWAALLIPAQGPAKKVRQAEKRQLLRMDFATFRSVFIETPAQIIRTGRKLVLRFLNSNHWQHLLFSLHDSLRRPLRC